MRADHPTHRGLLLTAGVVALAAAVAFQGIGETTSSAGKTPAAEPSPPPAASVISIDAFCASYTAFAQSYNVAITATGDSTAVDQLEHAGEQLRTAGAAPGMGPMEMAGRDRFVADAISSAGGAPSALGDPQLADEQLLAFSRYLATACPGL